jgi:hypothetical protein
VTAAIDVSRGSFLEATVVLERVEGRVTTELERTTRGLGLLTGTSLLAVPFTAPLGVGSYHVRLETVIYDGLTETNPSPATRSAWPRQQVLSGGEEGDLFSCGGVAPTFDSTPPMIAHVDDLLEYQPQVHNALSRRFSLIAGPGGATVDRTTGAVAWIPSSRDLGLTTFILLVEDPVLERVAVQAFEIVVVTP